MTLTWFGRYVSLDKRLTIVLLITGVSIILGTFLMSMVEQNEALNAINRAGVGIVLMTMCVNALQDDKNF